MNVMVFVSRVLCFLSRSKRYFIRFVYGYLVWFPKCILGVRRALAVNSRLEFRSGLSFAKFITQMFPNLSIPAHLKLAICVSRIPFVCNILVGFFIIFFFQWFKNRFLSLTVYVFMLFDFDNSPERVKKTKKKMFSYLHNVRTSYNEMYKTEYIKQKKKK